MGNLTAIIIILIIWLIFFKLIWDKLEPVPKIPDNKSNNWNNLSPEMKKKYLNDFYNGEPINSGTKKNIIEEDIIFINNLPKSNTGCLDNYSKCETWANNGECEINPEYMLYFCPKSCKACKYTPADKFKLVEIYNRKMPNHCVYHGEPYPSNFRDMSHLYFSNY